MHETIQNLERELAAVQVECDTARDKYRSLLADAGELEYRIRDLRGRSADEPSPYLVEVCCEPSQLGSEPSRSPDDGMPMDVDLHGATDHVERWRRLVIHTGQREWHIDEVSQWVVDMGAASAKPESVRSKLYGQIKEDPDFERVRPRVYCYTGALDGTFPG